MRTALLGVALVLVSLTSGVAQEPPTAPTISVIADTMGRDPDGGGGAAFSGNVVISINGIQVTAGQAIYRMTRNEIDLADGAVLIKLASKPVRFDFRARGPAR